MGSEGQCLYAGPQPPASGGVQLLNTTIMEPSAGAETEQSRKNSCPLSRAGRALPPAVTRTRISTGIYRRSWETWAQSGADHCASLLRCGICVSGLPCEPAGKNIIKDKMKQMVAVVMKLRPAGEPSAG